MIVFLGTQFFLLSVVMLIFTIAFYIYADIYFMANQMNGSLQTLYGHIGVLNRDKLNKELKIPFKRSKMNFWLNWQVDFYIIVLIILLIWFVILIMKDKKKDEETNTITKQQEQK